MAQQTRSAGAPPGLRALKILVVAMGLAIIACIVVIVVTLANRLSETEPAEAGPPAAQASGPVASSPVALSPTVAPVVPWGDLSISIPAGCVIAAAELAGGHLLLRLDGLAERGCQQVMLIGLADGNIEARITAHPEDQPGDAAGEPAQ